MSPSTPGPRPEHHLKCHPYPRTTAPTANPRAPTGAPPEVSPVPLLLIRHGESTWNAARRWQGHADPPLSEQGRDQARRAGVRLLAAQEVPTIGTLWSSDLRRARETARIIAAELGLEPRVHPGVRERTAGPWEGLTREEIDAGWPDYLERRRRPEGFESDADLAERVVPALTEIARLVAAEDSGVPAIVTHGGVIGVVDRLAGSERRRFPNLVAVRFDLDPATGEITGGPLLDLAAPS